LGNVLFVTESTFQQSTLLCDVFIERMLALSTPSLRRGTTSRDQGRTAEGTASITALDWAVMILIASARPDSHATRAFTVMRQHVISLVRQVARPVAQPEAVAGGQASSDAQLPSVPAVEASAVSLALRLERVQRLLSSLLVVPSMEHRASVLLQLALSWMHTRSTAVSRQSAVSSWNDDVITAMGRHVLVGLFVTFPATRASLLEHVLSTIAEVSCDVEQMGCRAYHSLSLCLIDQEPNMHTRVTFIEILEEFLAADRLALQPHLETIKVCLPVL